MLMELLGEGMKRATGDKGGSVNTGCDGSRGQGANKSDGNGQGKCQR